MSKAMKGERDGDGDRERERKEVRKVFISVWNEKTNNCNQLFIALEKWWLIT